MNAQTTNYHANRRGYGRRLTALLLCLLMLFTMNGAAAGAIALPDSADTAQIAPDAQDVETPAPAEAAVPEEAETTAKATDEPEVPNEPAPENNRSAENYVGGTVSMVGTQGYDLPTEDCEYNLTTDTSGFITIGYKADANTGTDNTVLVFTLPAYGMQFVESSLPVVGMSNVAAREVVGQSLYIQFSDGMTSWFTTTIEFTTRNLTQAQAEQWMDNGSLPATRFSLTEYRLVDDGVYTDVLTNGSPAYSETHSVWMTPDDCGGTGVFDWVEGYTYKWGVAASNSVNLNHSLYAACQYDSDSNVRERYVADGLVDGWRNGELRWSFPALETATNTLVEIESVKLYVPDARLKLTALLQSNGGDTVDYVTGWTIGARQQDENGVYYMITPSTRYFNAVTAGGQKAYFGFTPRFALVSADDTLPSNLYNTTGSHSYTDYSAADTVVTYRVAGEPGSRTMTATGPKIRAVSRVYTYSLQSAYPVARFDDNREADKTKSNVVIGTKTGHVFTYTCNNWEVGNYRSTSAPTYEIIPGLNGKIVQTYTFDDAAIQPSAIVLSSNLRNEYTKTNHVLASMTYTTVDGEEHPLTDAQVSAVNTAIQVSGSSTYTFTFPTDVVTAENRVTKVVVNWAKLYVDRYTMHYNCHVGMVNGTNGSGSNMVHTITDRSNNSYVTLSVSFNYRVNEYHDDAATQLCQHGDAAYVNYSIQAYTAEDPDTVRYETSQALYFRLVDQPCPPLKCTTHKSQYAQTGYYYMTECEPTPDAEPYPQISIGTVGFDIATYGKYKDIVHNPCINFGVDSSPGGLSSASYLAGIFNCTKKMSGWTFDYTVKHQTTGESLTLHYTVPELTATTRIKLPVGDGYVMQSGYYITALSIHYDGEFDLSHSSPSDATREVTLLSAIYACPLRYNPFTGARLTISSVSQIRFNPRLYYDDCTCDNNLHISGEATASDNRPGCNLVYMRNAQLTRDTGVRTTSANTIPQGQPVTISLSPRLKVVPGDRKNFRELSSISARGQNQGGTHPITVPWGVDDYVYIELTDTDNFTVDYANSYFYGVRLTDARVTYDPDFVIRDPDTGVQRHFLMLYMPYTAARTGDPGVYSPQNATRLSGGLFIRNTQNMSSNIYISGKIDLKLIALPGADEGVHYPIGEVYYDYSELLRMYDAPRFTGYDNDVTNYYMSGAVHDTLGLASFQTASEANIIRDRLGVGGNLATPITITKTGFVGDTIIPGVGVQYDAVNYNKSFTSADRENLTQLSTVMGAVQSAIYDLNVYQSLPRDGSGVTYTDETQTQQTATSDLTLTLRQEIEELSCSEGVTGLSVTYTTDDSPGEDSAYVPFDQIAALSDVTGFKIHADYMPSDAMIRFRLRLQADQKTDFGDLIGYSGGTYTAQIGGPEAEVGRGDINLAAWTYTDAVLKGGSVFWDLYNENGARDTSTAAISNIESLIAGLPVTLYAPDGVTVLEQTETTATANAFTLHTYLADPGQIIEIGLPDGDGATVKLTKTSASAIGTTSNDNDFDRDVSVNPLGAAVRLTLPAVTGNLQNISAGFVKLPEITAPDISVLVGQTLDTAAVLTEYFRSTLPAGAYNLTFTDAADPSVASVGEGTAVLKITDSGAVQTVSGAMEDSAVGDVAGLHVGETTATVTATNVLGDEITATYTIRVTAPCVTVTKQVVGAGTGPFPFEMTVVYNGEAFIPAAGEGYAVDAQGVITFTLANGQSVTVPELPYGAAVTVTETAHTCYSTSYERDGVTVADGDVLAFTVDEAVIAVTAVNTDDHDWVFTGFTWTGNDEDGYTAAIANYVCNNGEPHYATVDAELTVVRTEPSCTEPGRIVYTASVTAEISLDGEAHSEDKIVPLPPTEHDWEFTGFTWTGNDEDGYTAAVANYVCNNGTPHYATVDAELSIVRTEPTCEAPGKIVYTAYVSAEDSLDEEEHSEDKIVPIAPLGHNWEFTGFTWIGSDTDGYTAAIANYVCNNGEPHYATVDAELTVVRTEPSCTEPGRIVYTASVTAEISLDGEAHSEDKIVPLPPTEHDWEFTGFTWTGNDEDGYTAAVANYVCNNGEPHYGTADAAVSHVHIDPTCEVPGRDVYTAYISAEDSLDGEEHTEEKVFPIPPLGHNWVFTGFTWTGNNTDGYVVIANYVCDNGAAHTGTVVAAVTAERTEPTCTEAGSVVYTAVVTAENSLDGEEHTDTKTFALPALGHDWGPWTVIREATFEQDGLEERVCQRCGLTEQRTIVWDGKATRLIQFVMYQPMHYIVHVRNGEDYRIYSDTTPEILWYPDYPLTFDVYIYTTWDVRNWIVSANGVELKPNADGSYTIPAGSERVVINCNPVQPETPAQEGQLQSGKVCAYCGNVHTNNLRGFLVGMLHSLFVFFKNLGG